MLKIVIIAVIVMLTVVGILCFKAVSMGKTPIQPVVDSSGIHYTPTKVSSSYSSIGDTKEFIPVTNLDDYSFCVGDFNYRAIIKCSAVNFGLMNSMEQDRVEASYAQYLNSLSFPIENYTQTREFDKDTMLDNVHANKERAIKKFPMIAAYGNAYEEQLSYLMGEYIQNTKTKKNFVIISYGLNDMTDVSALSATEVKEFALQELSTRASIIKNGLESVGIPCEILDKKGIVEVLYSYYHRDYYKISRDFAAGLYNSVFISKKEKNNYFDKEVLDRILAESQDKVRRLAGPASTKEEIAFYEYIYQTLDSLRAIPTDNYEYYKSIMYPEEQANEWNSTEAETSEQKNQDFDSNTEKTVQLNQNVNHQNLYQVESYSNALSGNENGGM